MDRWMMDNTKLMYHPDRIADFLASKPIIPIHIDIGVTKKCNLRCSYCYGTFQKFTGEVIKSDVLINLFKQAGQIGVRSITVTGDGEPTLNPAIYEALSVGKEYGLDLGFATNGYKLSYDEKIILLKTLTWLRFNISAYTVKGYSKVHNGSEHFRNKVIANIKEIVELKHKLKSTTTVGLQMVLIPECVDEIIPLAKFAIDTGVDYFVIKQFSDPGEAIEASYDLAKTKEWQGLLNQAEAMSNNKTQIIVKWNNIKRQGKRDYDRCVDCAFIFQISGNSKCYPCGFLFNNEKYCYGDLNKNTLLEILQSNQYKKVIYEMRHNFDVHTKCEGSCRHDSTNSYIWKLLHPPEHVNFI